MKNSILVSLVVFAICSACSNERETASGQKFTVMKKGDGKEIKTKQIMLIDYSLKDGKDSVWFDTRKNNYPQPMQKQAQPQGRDAVMEVIYMLTKGDSVTVRISATDLFTKAGQPFPPKVDSTSFFTFYITMKDVLDSVQFTKYREELMAKQNEKALKQEKEQLAKDSVIIANYLKEKNVTAQATPSGLRYVITKPGKGENAKDGQTAKVNYAGYLLNGKYFDTSIESVAKAQGIYQESRGGYAPYPVPVGQGRVIKGWDEALKLMNKGCKMTVYIPSGLAYGPRKRDENLVENSILVFDMEVVDIQ